MDGVEKDSNIHRQIGFENASIISTPNSSFSQKPHRPWDISLLNWVNCVLGSESFSALSLKALYALIKHFDNVTGCSESDQPTEDLVFRFLKKEYPYFRYGIVANVTIHSDDIILILSLLLHYSCVKSKDITIHGKMCKTLDTTDQKAIAAFANSLMRHENITERNLLNAIKATTAENKYFEECFDEKSSPFLKKQDNLDSPLSKSFASPLLQTPLRKSRKVFHLEAELGAERFDKNFLQDEVDRLQRHLTEFEIREKLNTHEILQLRRELSLIQDNKKENFSESESCDHCKYKDKILQEELRTHELEILRLLSNIQNLEDQTDLLTTKLNEADNAVSLLSSRAIQSENAESFLKSQVNEMECKLSNLEIELSYTKQCLKEYNKENNLNRSIECDDDTLHLRKNSDYSIISSPENLGKVVIDVQLKEQISKNNSLSNQINILKKERDNLEIEFQKIHNAYTIQLNIDHSLKEENEKMSFKLQYLLELEKQFKECKENLDTEISTVKKLTSETEMLSNENNILQDKLKNNELIVHDLNMNINILNESVMAFSQKCEDSEMLQTQLLDDNNNLKEMLKSKIEEATILATNILTCENTIKDCKMQIEKHIREIDGKETQLDSLNVKYHDLVNTNDSMTNEISLLKCENSKLQQQAKLQEDQIEACNARYLTEHEKLIASEDLNNILNKKLSVVDKQLKIITQESDDIAVKYSQISEEINICKNKIETYEEKIKEYINTEHDQQTEISKLKQQCDSKDEKIKNIQSDVKGKNLKILNYESEISNYKINNENFEEKIKIIEEKYSESCSKIDSLLCSNQEFENKITDLKLSLEKKNQELFVVFTDYQNICDENSTKKVQIERLENDLKSHMNVELSLKSDMFKMKYENEIANKNMIELQSASDEKQIKILELKNEIMNVQNALHLKTAEMMDIELKRTADIEANDYLTNSNLELTQKLADVKSSMEKKILEIETLDTNFNSLNEKYLNHIDKFEKEMKTHVDTEEKLNSEINIMKKDCEKMNENVNNLQALLNEKASEVLQLKDEMVNIQNKLSEKNSEIANSELQFKLSMDKTNLHESENKELTERLANIEYALTSKTREFEILNISHANLNKKYIEQVDKSEKELNIHAEIELKLNSKIILMNEELENMNKSISYMKKQLDEKTQEAHHLKEEITNIRIELSGKKTEIENSEIKSKCNIEKIDHFIHENKELMQKFTNIESDLTSKTREFEILEASHESLIGKYSQQVDKLERELKTHINTEHKLNSEIILMKEEVENMNKNITNMKKELKEKNCEALHLNDEIINIQSELSVKNFEIANQELKSKCDMDKISFLQSENKELTQKLANSESDLILKTQEFEFLSISYASLNKKYLEEVDKLERKINILAEIEQKLNSEIILIKEEYENKIINISDLKKELEEKNFEVLHLKNEMLIIQSELTDKNNQIIHEFRSVKESLSAEKDLELTQISNENIKLTNLLDAQKNEVVKSKNEIEAMNTKLNHIADEKCKLDVHLSEVESNLNMKMKEIEELSTCLKHKQDEIVLCEKRLEAYKNKDEEIANIKTEMENIDIQHSLHYGMKISDPISNHNMKSPSFELDLKTEIQKHEDYIDENISNQTNDNINMELIESNDIHINKLSDLLTKELLKNKDLCRMLNVSMKNSENFVRNTKLSLYMNKFKIEEIVKKFIYHLINENKSNETHGPLTTDQSESFVSLDGNLSFESFNTDILHYFDPNEKSFSHFDENEPNFIFDEIDNGNAIVNHPNEINNYISSPSHSTELIAKACAQNILMKDDIILNLKNKCYTLNEEILSLTCENENLKLKIEKLSMTNIDSNLSDDFQEKHISGNSPFNDNGLRMQGYEKYDEKMDSSKELITSTTSFNVCDSVDLVVNEYKNLKEQIESHERNTERITQIVETMKTNIDECEAFSTDILSAKLKMEDEYKHLKQLLKSMKSKIFIHFQNKNEMNAISSYISKLKTIVTLIKDDFLNLNKNLFDLASFKKWFHHQINTLINDKISNVENIELKSVFIESSKLIDSLRTHFVNTEEISKEYNAYLSSIEDDETITAVEDFKKYNSSYECILYISKEYMSLQKDIATLKMQNKISENNACEIEKKRSIMIQENQRLFRENDGLKQKLLDQNSQIDNLMKQSVENKLLIESKEIALSNNKKLILENTKLREDVETLTIKLNDVNMRMYTENVKPLIDFDKILQENMKLADAMKQSEQDKQYTEAEYATLKSAYNQLMTEHENLKASSSQDNVNRLIANMRSEYEDKLSKMKLKMKQLYQEQISVYIEKQKEELAQSEQLCKKYATKIKSYESHVNQLSSELWKVGEKLLMEKNEKDWLKQQLRERFGSRQSLQFGVPNVDNDLRPANSVLKVFDESIKDILNENVGKSVSKRNKAESGGLHMSDEESEIFDNTYLADLKSGVCKPRHTSKSNAARNLDLQPDRLSELQWRNSLCLPHLKSSYPAETQFHKFKEEDIKMGSLNNDDEKSSRPKKEVGQTTYKKPGPPTPSKKGGRLSLQGNDAREPLKEQNDNSTKKVSTPSRIKSLFMGHSSRSTTRDENTFGTPKGRRLSIFRKPR